MKKYALILALLAAVTTWFVHLNLIETRRLQPENTGDLQQYEQPTEEGGVFDWLKPTAAPTPTPLPAPPTQQILSGGTHAFQTFNNCGPAALSMALSHYGITATQQELGQALRPYQVVGGDNDDKSVTLEELADKAPDYGFTAYHRPNGTITKVQQFIAHGIPVVMRTWLDVNDDIGHYRVVKGYNATTRQLLQDDSLQGKDLWYSEDTFNTIWEKYNYEFLVLVPAEKISLAEQILGEDSDKQTAWENAVQNAETQLRTAPNDMYARFNLSVALQNSGNPQRAVEEYEKVEAQLPSRTLWYQIEPIQAYAELGNTARVFAITDRILNNHNRAFSELYLIRGKIYKAQGNLDLAREEFEKAVLYNRSNPVFQRALNELH